MAKKLFIAEGFASRLARMLAWWESQTDLVTFRTPRMTPPPGSVVYRQGKLDGNLAVGGTQTVSIWNNDTTGSYFEDMDTDTGENWTDCIAPFTLSSTAASGSTCGVLQLAGVRMILWIGCPT